MRRLSSNLSILFRIFLPLVYIVFFGSLIIGSFIASVNDAPLVANPFFRYGLLGTFVVFVLIFRLTVMRLKRVDADSTYLYVSNYIKTYRYTWPSINKLTTVNLLIFDIIYIHFNDETQFGKKVFFLASRSLVKSFFAENTELFSYIDPSVAQE